MPQNILHFKFLAFASFLFLHFKTPYIYIYIYISFWCHSIGSATKSTQYIQCGDVAVFYHSFPVRSSTSASRPFKINPNYCNRRERISLYALCEHAKEMY